MLGDNSVLLQLRRILFDSRLEVGQRPVFAGVGHFLHGLDSGALVLQGQLSAHNVVNLFRPVQIRCYSSGVVKSGGDGEILTVAA